jgi:hypothetical protein
MEDTWTEHVVMLESDSALEVAIQDVNGKKLQEPALGNRTPNPFFRMTARFRTPRRTAEKHYENQQPN